MPEHLRKKIFKCDKDGTGVLESNNTNGINEIDLMSKYWTEVSQHTLDGNVINQQTFNPQKPQRNNVYSSTIFDKNGNKIKEISMNLTNFEYVETSSTSTNKFYFELGYSTFTKSHNRNIKAKEKEGFTNN